MAVILLGSMSFLDQLKHMTEVSDFEMETSTLSVIKEEGQVFIVFSSLDHDMQCVKSQFATCFYRFGLN